MKSNEKKGKVMKNNEENIKCNEENKNAMKNNEENIKCNEENIKCNEIIKKT
jgi:hypothetical protein